MSLKTSKELRTLRARIAEVARVANTSNIETNATSRISQVVALDLCNAGFLCRTIEGPSGTLFILLKLKEGVFSIDIPHCVYTDREASNRLVYASFTIDDIFNQITYLWVWKNLNPLPMTNLLG